MKIYLLTAICAFQILTLSCNKGFHSQSSDLQYSNQPKEAFHKYLVDLLLKQSEPIHRENLSALENNLIPGLNMEYTLNDTIQIQIIPLKNRPEYFHTSTDVGNWFVVYRFNESLNIQRMEVLNFNAASNIDAQGGIESIYKLYKFDIPLDGVYTTYSIGGRFLFQQEYINRRERKFVMIVPDTKNTDMLTDGKRDWLLFTSEIKSTGEIKTYSRFLFTTHSYTCSPGDITIGAQTACDPIGIPF